MSVTGRVARILDENSLVLNVGEQEGVQKGMKFVVYEPGEEIKDPVTGASLGALEIVKAEVVAVHVQEHLTLAKSLLVQQEESSPTVLSARLQDTHSTVRSGPMHQKLYVRMSDISGVAQVKPVAVGDCVRSVAG